MTKHWTQLSPHTRKFDGKIYHRVLTARTKERARETAEGWKKLDLKHRIVKVKDGYTVYSRQE